MTNDLPLTGLKIVVTRPRDQAVQLARRIEQAGGIPLLFPLLDITAVQDTKTLHEQIARLGQFNLTIFISPNAVHYGIASIRAAGASLSPDGTTDMTTSHLTNPAKDAGQVIGYSHSTKSSKNGNQVAGYAVLRKWGKQAIRVADRRPLVGHLGEL